MSGPEALRQILLNEVRLKEARRRHYALVIKGHTLSQEKDGPQETVTTALVISLWYNDKNMKNAMF